MFRILVIDDDPIIRTVLQRTLKNQGYQVTVADNGIEGIAQAKNLRPALIICDWVMTPIDGIEVCRTIKSDVDLATTFLVLLTAKGAVEDRVIGLDAGADEFLSKPIEMNELKARVRAGLRLYQLNEDLRTQKHNLQILNQKLQAELDEAAEYVRSLLPAPRSGKISIETFFRPSAQLGGDCFDYYEIDPETIAIYLLDVSGHGVGAALLSISVLNVLRSQSLPNTNFTDPAQVLKALNQAFPMSEHGDKYFTIWYGVYHSDRRQLVYSSAGHPPAILVAKQAEEELQIKQLGKPDLPIGMLSDVVFQKYYIEIAGVSDLYLFSDGAYEIRISDTQIWGLDAFLELIGECYKSQTDKLQQLVDKIKQVTFKDDFDDDLSLVKVKFLNEN
ncbi:PP2C family protein-serine/threonine phosphatase [Merismopedia glauca]|uniref:Regulator n=1 Tax=Merismopedia glauca CCAP 1448/3 TaxID=1296344 RepID=A0A2T1C389_9CYAN|nr:SpoIIE family protein phosphatase [Merismopedia glauca]PSB02648.1 regulator [Merismopedia glauca CCAP 1448/3]